MTVTFGGTYSVERCGFFAKREQRALQAAFEEQTDAITNQLAPWLHLDGGVYARQVFKQHMPADVHLMIREPGPQGLHFIALGANVQPQQDVHNPAQTPLPVIERKDFGPLSREPWRQFVERVLAQAKTYEQQIREASPGLAAHLDNVWDKATTQEEEQATKS